MESGPKFPQGSRGVPDVMTFGKSLRSLGGSGRLSSSQQHQKVTDPSIKCNVLDLQMVIDSLKSMRQDRGDHSEVVWSANWRGQLLGMILEAKH